MLHAGGAEQAPPVVPVPRDGPLPLSFAQQRLWFIQQMEPRSVAYNMPYALRMGGALDVDVLERALDALVARHESLRTVFPASGGEPVQVVLPPAPVDPPKVDLRPLPADAREDELRRRMRQEAERPFDLAAGPLLRVALLRLDEEDTAVLFTLHHIVGDGWSRDVLVREVSELYGAFAEGREPALPALPVQYADFAAWQRAWLAGPVLDGAAGLLARPPGRRAAPAGAGHGPAPHHRRRRPRRKAARSALRGGVGRAPRPVAGRGRHAVHGAAGRRSRPSWAATPGRTTWWSARPWPGARGRSWRT